MSVKPVSRVSAKTGALKKGYRVDVTVQQPDGTVVRKQKRLMGVSKRDAEKYERELRSLLINGEPSVKLQKNQKMRCGQFFQIIRGRECNSKASTGLSSKRSRRDVLPLRSCSRKD